MSNNFYITNETMTYAEYIHKFRMIHHIKRNTIKLNLPLDEIPYLSLMSEEDVFLRQWDIDTFGFNSIGNYVKCGLIKKIKNLQKILLW